LKKNGSSVIITTHRPRLIGVVDKLLVLRHGRQVGFGSAEEMINAVRNLQAVTPTSAEKTSETGSKETPLGNEGTIRGVTEA
jgi:ABC-type protease/lipase transport system fused ATPase/permease subunit